MLQAEAPGFVEKVKGWMDKAYENKSLELDKMSHSDFVCVLLDLILYENPHLVNQAFKLLVRFF